MAELYQLKPGENRLVNVNLEGLFSLSPGKRASLLNSQEESSKHNQSMQEAADAEFNDPPIADIAEKIKASAADIKEKATGALKEAVKAPFKLAAHVITKPVEWIGKPILSLVTGVSKGAISIVGNTVGLASTAPRMVMDAARLAARPPLILLDKLSVGAGYPSKIIRTTKEKALNAIDSANEKIYDYMGQTRESIFNTLGAES